MMRFIGFLHFQFLLSHFLTHIQYLPYISSKLANNIESIMKPPFSSFLFLCLPLFVRGYQTPLTRRGVFRRLLSASSVAAFASTISTAPAQAVLSSKYCAAGVGEGCNDLSEGNELIRSLQEKSAAKREQYAMVRLGVLFL